MDAPPAKLAYSVKEAAAMIGVSRAKLYDLIRRGLVRATKIDGCTRVRPAALEAYLDMLDAAPPPEPPMPSREPVVIRPYNHRTRR